MIIWNEEIITLWIECENNKLHAKQTKKRERKLYRERDSISWIIERRTQNKHNNEKRKRKKKKRKNGKSGKLLNWTDSKRLSVFQSD